jgi:hypothetical protein
MACYTQGFINRLCCDPATVTTPSTLNRLNRLTVFRAARAQLYLVKNDVTGGAFSACIETFLGEFEDEIFKSCN